jgi:hypothetical protein
MSILEPPFGNPFRLLNSFQNIPEGPYLFRKVVRV